MWCVDSSCSPLSAHWPSLSARLWRDFAAWLASELKVILPFQILNSVWISNNRDKSNQLTKTGHIWLIWLPEKTVGICGDYCGWLNVPPRSSMPTNPGQTLSRARWTLNGLQVWGSLRAPASKCQRESKERITARAYFRWSSKEKPRCVLTEEEIECIASKKLC